MHFKLEFLKAYIVKRFFFHYQDYTDRDVRVISRARIDELTSYIEDKNTDNHVAQVNPLITARL